MRLSKFRIAPILLSFLSGFAMASTKQLEQYAALAASAASANYKKGLPQDGVTTSAAAYARGGRLIHEYVLRLRADVTEKELKTWRAGVRGELVPDTCKTLSNDDFFKSKGFEVQFRYFNQNNQLLDEILINKPACAVYGY